MKLSEICCETLEAALEDARMPLCITNKKDCYGEGIIALKWQCKKRYEIIPFYFCPWCGSELEQAKVCSLKHKIALLSNDTTLRVFDDLFNVYTDIPNNLKYLLESDNWREIDNQNRRNEHYNEGVCSELEYDVDGEAPVIYRDNLRVFGILCDSVVPEGLSVHEISHFKNNHRYIPINYCYYCGDAIYKANLINQLDKILREEYGLDSWKDYKKAPHEFHTYEWWEKRGL